MISICVLSVESPPAAKIILFSVPVPSVARTRFPAPVVPYGADIKIYPSFGPVMVNPGSSN